MFKERFTPTGVGTITSARIRAYRSAVHPHGRGDNAVTPNAVVIFGGSPPRAWGQSTVVLTRRHNTGSPPRAWGQLRASAVCWGAFRFTPMGVGTMSLEVFAYLLAAGSPPRAWGQCRVCLLDRVARRFTPTGVGTIPDVDRAARFWNGSPPRAWGQLRQHVDAGGSALVHPHGRGDNDNRVQSAYACSWFTPTGVGTIPNGWSRATDPHGSPPRAWGQLLLLVTNQPRKRFTPTGVGTILASQAF